MKIYLATPVNARKEKTLGDKRRAAYARMVEMKYFMQRFYPDAEYHSSFDEDIAPLGCYNWTEAFIMGCCVTCVMLCDMIILDDGWENSKGCTVERFVAMQYGKQVRTFNSFVLKEKLNK